MGWEMATLAWGKGGFWDPLLRADGAGEVGRAVLPTFLVSPVCGAWEDVGAEDRSVAH